ncbi:MAG: hypothetical protein HY608_04850 [Planctomycetes bacterium]|nr:hypothetical protein [Planctomycetota bacterium]
MNRTARTFDHPVMRTLSLLLVCAILNLGLPRAASAVGAAFGDEERQALRSLEAAAPAEVRSFEGGAVPIGAALIFLAIFLFEMALDRGIVTCG